MSASPAGVTAEIDGFSHPGAIPTPWAAGLREVIAADTFWLDRSRGRTAARHAADRRLAR